jgi:hypothetical protein
MAERLRLISERGDDIPLWLGQVERMGVPPLLDEPCPTHGHGVGLSLGWVMVLWVTHLLSEANPRLHHGEPWAAQRLHTLRGCTGPPVHPLDLGDDRLAGVLAALRDDAGWGALEGALTRQRLRVYDLQPACGRLDSTTASGHWTVTEDGRCQFGHSQDHRPDLPHVNVRRSALDPLGLPWATDVVPGQRADAPRDIPAIRRVRESLARRGLRYVGDGTMGALETRACLQTGADCSRCPRSESQLPPEVVEGSLVPVWTGPQPLPRITRMAASGTRACLADGDARPEPVTVVVAGEGLTWPERRLVLRSRQWARAGEAARRARVATAQAAVAALHERGRGTPRVTARPAVPAAVEAILRR